MLKVWYMSHGDTGLQERNITCQFVMVMDHKQEDLLPWFEYQFGENANEHQDAVVIDPTNKVIYLIESKRFQNDRKRISSIHDVERIIAIAKNHKEIEERFYDSVNFDEYKLIGVILGDVWRGEH